MNRKEIVELIKSQVTDAGNDPDEMFDADEESGADFRKLEAAGFKIEEIEREGGEGQGEEYYAVLKVTKEGEKDLFVKCDAYYASYEGTNWEYGGTYEVVPKKVEVTQWAKVK